jgi:hypothetical protein
MFKPFVINSNIVTSYSDIASFDAFMEATACNTGNSYITYSLLKELGVPLDSIKGYEIKNIYTYDFAHNESRDIDTINNECTHILLMLQDQIRIHESYGYRLPFIQLTNFLKQTKCPIIVAGLGANSLEGYVPNFHLILDKEQITFWRYLSARCDVMGIRGSFTEEVLHNIGVDNTQVIGCPTYYECGEKKQIFKREWHEKMSIGCSSVFASCVQDAIVYLQDLGEERIIKIIGFNARGVIDAQLIEDIKNQRYRIFSSINEWKKNLADKEFFFGTRVHGGVIALNCGVPVCVLNGDARAREMCEYMNIPYFAGYPIRGINDVEKLYHTCDYNKLNQQYPAKFLNYISFLKRNDLTYCPIPNYEHGFGLALYDNINIQYFKRLALIRNVVRPFLPKPLKSKLKTFVPVIHR